jgi:tRNA dimethylallyltransferase
MGATATGKSAVGIRIASLLGGEIISMDSRQVYRGMDIGTAKVPPSARQGILHHLIDVLDPDESNSAGHHAAEAARLIEEIHARGNLPVLVGGTGLYFRALFEGLSTIEIPRSRLESLRRSFDGVATDELYAELVARDPERAEALSPNDRLRITRALEVVMLTGRRMTEYFKEQDSARRYDPLKIILTMPRWELRETIARRSRAMFESGWIEEVEALRARGYDSSSPGMNSLGYKQISLALERGTDPTRELERIITLTRQYAKRQETFFRKEAGAHWLDASRPGFADEAVELAGKYLRFKNDLT